MEKKFIMTAFGKDRPGIVAEITEIIYENKCNLEDSNMGRLADEFTLILLLTGNGDDLQERLSKECKRLEIEKDISAFIRPLDFQQPEPQKSNNIHSVEMEGVDQAGIVYKMARLLADEKINIETLHSTKNHYPNSGTAMYNMNMAIKMPEETTLAAIEPQFEELANELNVDISIN